MSTLNPNLQSLVQEFYDRTYSSGEHPLLVILGPTASGKTALSIEIAKKFGGEIVSADSRQVYKFMDIGTDKIDETRRKEIPHHLIDILTPDIHFTLSDYKRMAEKAINDILLRKKEPLLVGGTGLYISAIVKNYNIPETGDTTHFRDELQKIADTHGSNVLYEKLQEVDPRAAKRIHPENARYIIRALEINHFTGSNKDDLASEPQYEVFKIGIEWPREILYQRIDERVEDQFKHGLVDEVKDLLERGYTRSLPSMSSLGYQEVLDYLDGSISLEETKERIKFNTHSYARRQLSWWRRESDIFWVKGEEL